MVIVMKLITNIIIVLSWLLTIYYLYLHLIPFDISKIILGFTSIMLLSSPILICKFSKFKIEEYIKLIYYFFLLVAFILGLLFGLYYSTSFLDLVVHGLFGFLLSITITEKIQSNSWKNILLIVSIVISIGFLWETLEFLSDVFMSTDHQERINGARDTMSDLLVTVIGSFIYTVYYWIMNKIKI